MSSSLRDWAAHRIAKRSVLEIHNDGINGLRVKRDPRLWREGVDGRPRPSEVRLTFAVETMMTAQAAEIILRERPQTSAIVNVGRFCHYSGAAKALAHERNVEIYTFGEVASALESPQFWGHEWSYRRRIKSNLTREHTRVSSVSHICEELLLVDRVGLPPVQLIVADVYVLGVVELLTILEKHPDAAAIVNFGSYTQYTDEAKHRAISMGVGLFQYGQLLGALHLEGHRFVNHGRA